MSHFPLYGFFNMIADTGHIPRNTFWFVLAMFFTVIASLFVYRVSEGNLLAAILFAAVLLSVATPMRLVPGLMTGMFLVFAVGLSYKELAK